MNYSDKIKYQINSFQEQLKNNIYLLEDKNIQNDTEKYAQTLYHTGLLKGKIEGLQLAITFYNKPTVKDL